MRMGEERPRHLKLENICTVDVNQVLETRFTGGLSCDKSATSDPIKA